MGLGLVPGVEYLGLAFHLLCIFFFFFTLAQSML